MSTQYHHCKSLELIKTFGGYNIKNEYQKKDGSG